MSAKSLNESSLKALFSKHKVKDNGLQKALAAYDKLDDDAHDDCLETIAQIGKLAAALKKAKDVAANKAVVEYLEDLLDAADSEEKDVTKDKAAAEKAEAAEQKKAQKEKEKEEEDEEDEEDEEELSGEYGERLLTALKKLKSMNGKPMKFVVCDARPFCGLAIGKRVGSKQKEELTALTGGSKRFLKPAICFWDGDQYVFEPEQMVPGLAKKLVRSVKNFTGKKFRMVVGDETAGGDEEEEEGQETEGQETEAKRTEGAEVEAEQPDETGVPGGGAVTEEDIPKPVPPPILGKAELRRAPAVWHGTRDVLQKNIDALKKAVTNHYGSEHPDLLKEIEQSMGKLNGILETLDTELADSLATAHDAADEAARKEELKNSKRILTEYIKYVKAEPLIAHIDSNPFGVDTKLKKVLADALTHMAQAIA